MGKGTVRAVVVDEFSGASRSAGKAFVYAESWAVALLELALAKTETKSEG